MRPYSPVEGAEVIDVDEDQRQRQAVTPRAPPLAFEKLEELFVVGDRGQLIFAAQPLQLNARRFELGRAGLERFSRAPRPGKQALRLT